MFELSVALKYLIPRWRQLSVSIISLISILVISLVVWLIVVFFSVATGLEKGWIQKLTALTAPIRITPTAEYYNSYYYQVDAISTASNYSPKSIWEKFQSPVTDPYDPDVDEALPTHWPHPDKDEEGRIKDPVKLAFSAVQELPNFSKLKAHDFEMAACNLHLDLIRDFSSDSQSYQEQSSLSQTVYLASFDEENTSLCRTALPVDAEDIANLRKEYPNFLEQPPLWLHFKDQKNHDQAVLPGATSLGDGALLPKGFKDAGVLVGDRGYLSYQTPTLSSMQEQRIPIYVAGFYDPGIIPLGGKVALVNREITSLIRSVYEQNDHTNFGNGIHVRFDDLSQADEVKAALQRTFQEKGIDHYWNIETFREYEFTKDLLQQLRSEKNLFTLIAIVIIIVACSNIISMLIILVNDKKKEIGILRSMGATSKSIAAIFGLCGIVMGILGSVIGIVAAVATLYNLQGLVNLISAWQGYEAFNVHFYGETLPNELSIEALSFVLIATSLISLLAGVVPAVKASLLRPSTILRAE